MTIIAGFTDAIGSETTGKGQQDMAKLLPVPAAFVKTSALLETEIDRSGRR
jgi:hypothetical protein